MNLFSTRFLSKNTNFDWLWSTSFTTLWMFAETERKPHLIEYGDMLQEWMLYQLPTSSDIQMRDLGERLGKLLGFIASTWLSHQRPKIPTFKFLQIKADSANSRSLLTNLRELAMLMKSKVFLWMCLIKTDIIKT